MTSSSSKVRSIVLIWKLRIFEILFRRIVLLSELFRAIHEYFSFLISSPRYEHRKNANSELTAAKPFSRKLWSGSRRPSSMFKLCKVLESYQKIRKFYLREKSYSVKRMAITGSACRREGFTGCWEFQLGSNTVQRPFGDLGSFFYWWSVISICSNGVNGLIMNWKVEREL